jgi:hypothetical protein
LTKTVAAEADKKGYERGLKEGKAFSATKQQVANAQTNPQGTLVPGTAAGSLPMSYEAYLNRTPEEDAAMTDETHRKMFEEGVRRHAQSR